MGSYKQIGGLDKICENVYIQVGPNSESNQGIIATDAGTILVDNYVKYYQALIDSLRKVNKPPVSFVINTHPDMDHFTANHLFHKEGAVIISSEWTRNRIALRMKQEPSLITNLNPSLAHKVKGLEDLIPDFVIQNKATLYLGGETIELRCMGHGHSPDDLIVFCSKSKVLFAGDLVFLGHHGRLRTANIEGLLSILDELSCYPFDFLIPGHGLPVKGTKAREALATYRDYIINLRDKIADMIAAGLTLDEIKDGFTNWKYQDWERSDLFPIAIENVYKEIQWRSRIWNYK